MADMGHRNCEMFTSNKKVVQFYRQWYSFIRLFDLVMLGSVKKNSQQFLTR